MIIVMTYPDQTIPVFTGQFPSHDAAVAWGRAWQDTYDDNPCWQVMNTPASFFNQRPTLIHPF